MSREPERAAAQVSSWCFEITAATDACERLVAELYALGTQGIEETPGQLRAYFASSDPAQTRAVHALGDAPRGIAVRGPVAVADEDWSLTWRRGLGPRRVGPISIRPTWCAPEPEPELCIDPEQAFGTGEHASTRIALRLMLARLEADDTVLDVGTGSGILAMSALRLGAGRAIGCDLDPSAAPIAARNAARNALGPHRLGLFTGTTAAIASDARFDVVVANMILSEIRPCFAALVRHTRRALVLSGLLARERGTVEQMASTASLRVASVESESQSGDDWLGVVLIPAHSADQAEPGPAPAPEVTRR